MENAVTLFWFMINQWIGLTVKFFEIVLTFSACPSWYVFLNLGGSNRKATVDLEISLRGREFESQWRPNFFWIFSVCKVESSSPDVCPTFLDFLY